MEEWMIDLIIGLGNLIVGFVGGFLTKTYSVKIKQQVKGNNNKQSVGEINNGK